MATPISGYITIVTPRRLPCRRQDAPRKTKVQHITLRHHIFSQAPADLDRKRALLPKSVDLLALGEDDLVFRVLAIVDLVGRAEGDDRQFRTAWWLLSRSACYRGLERGLREGLQEDLVSFPWQTGSGWRIAGPSCDVQRYQLR